MNGHKCGVMFCKTCTRERPYNHKCYMPSSKKKNFELDVPKHAFIYYDYETTPG